MRSPSIRNHCLASRSDQTSQTFTNAAVTTQDPELQVYRAFYGMPEGRVPDDVAAFNSMCSDLAGTQPGRSVAANGCIVESSLILTTSNLHGLLRAGLYSVDQLQGAAQHCWRRCIQLTSNAAAMKDFRLSKYLMKTAAYAWRQMVFYLSVTRADLDTFCDIGTGELDQSPSHPWGERWRKQLERLRACSSGTLAPGTWATPMRGWTVGPRG